jgi:hypothetical protein
MSQGVLAPAPEPKVDLGARVCGQIGYTGSSFSRFSSACSSPVGCRPLVE